VSRTKKPVELDAAQLAQITLIGATTVAAAQASAAADTERRRRCFINAAARIACAVSKNQPEGEALDTIKVILNNMIDAFGLKGS